MSEGDKELWKAVAASICVLVVFLLALPWLIGGLFTYYDWVKDIIT